MDVVVEDRETEDGVGVDLVVEDRETKDDVHVCERRGGRQTKGRGVWGVRGGGVVVEVKRDKGRGTRV